ncbi:MAG: hypothetical protein PHH24_00760 [Candidatus Moranbacteria bacterium]|jgi:hypothetical protein|nr:hypothetical protein [Candidatus Moranbacteria bacterium]MDD5651799.1 hypothetical protein [Candidatus Moranbacteria bacterium]MDX9855790.1 hypothetical protein [Candidatus Moranbacteria bacterium]
MNIDLRRSGHKKNNIRINHEGDYLEKPHDFMISEHSDVLIEWQGPEYEHYPKEKVWYLVASLILAAIVFYALINNSPIMAILFILIGIVGYIQLEKHPRVLDFKITHEGVMAGNELYDFDSVESFWIFYEPPHTKILSLHTDALLVPYVHIPVHQIDPVKLREVLMDFIPEKKQKPTMIDTIERLLHI